MQREEEEEGEAMMKVDDSFEEKENSRKRNERVVAVPVNPTQA